VPLSGVQVMKLYLKAGWDILRQKGSHVTVGCGDLEETIPLHRGLSLGLERKLLNRLTGMEKGDVGSR
jgi:predicted RNA binding protein YcfA (HicA-like mRNA interferase family)